MQRDVLKRFLQLQRLPSSALTSLRHTTDSLQGIIEVRKNITDTLTTPPQPSPDILTVRIVPEQTDYQVIFYKNTLQIIFLDNNGPMTTRAYNPLYLEDAMNNLGTMLDCAANVAHYDLLTFYEIFLSSGIASQMEIGNPRFVFVCFSTKERVRHQHRAFALSNATRG